MTKRTRPTRGRVTAYIGIATGGGLSIAANIAHTYIVQDDPSALAVIVALSWPVLLFICIEMIAHTRWIESAFWKLVRYAAATPVAILAAVVSYLHLSGLLASYSEEKVAVWFGPLAIDGLMIVATAALISEARIDQAARAAVVETWPPAEAWPRPAEAEPPSPWAHADPLPAPVPDPLPPPPEAGLGFPEPPLPPEPPVVVRKPEPATPNGRKPAADPPRPVEETRRLFAELKEAYPDMKREEAARRLGISTRALRLALNGSQPPAPVGS